MSDYMDRIAYAQMLAREQAAIGGASLDQIHMAGVRAAEQLVIANLRRKEAAAAVENEGGTNVIPFPKRQP